MAKNIMISVSMTLRGTLATIDEERLTAWLRANIPLAISWLQADAKVESESIAIMGTAEELT